jgi:uncharacterized protein (TIGR03086 family)
MRRVAELIELGRERDAVLLAAALSEAEGHDEQHPGGLMDALSQLEELGPLLAGVVGAIAPGQLGLPTPCKGFTVRGVLEHMVGGARAFAAAYRGEAAATPAATDVLAEFGPALTDLAAAISSPGALERTVQSPFGEVSGETFARFVVLDGLVHGWDMATSTGQAYTPSDALVASVQEFADQAIPPLRDGDTFGDAVEPAAGASPIERLAAFTGRRL